MPAPRWIRARRSARQEQAEALEAGYVQYLVDEDEFGEAERELRAEYEERERELGDEHPDTQAARVALADLLGERGSLEEAESEYGAVLEIQRGLLGLEHADTLITRSKLADVLVRRGVQEQQFLDEAERHYRVVLDARMRALGFEHPDTLAARAKLARVLYRPVIVRGAVVHGPGAADAELQYRLVLEARTRVLGADHPDTLDVRESLADLLADLGRYPSPS